MTDEPDITPPLGIPAFTLPAATPQVASVRPGHTAPAHDHAALPEPDDDLWTTLELARSLRSECRGFSAFVNDAAYHRLRPGLTALANAIERCIRFKVGDDELMDLFMEVRGLLPHDPGHH